MTRTIKALAFSALLCTTASFATSDNLLSMATDGAITTAKAEALSLNNNEMKSVTGGASYSSAIYAAAFVKAQTVYRYYTPMQKLSALTRVR